MIVRIKHKNEHSVIIYSLSLNVGHLCPTFFTIQWMFPMSNTFFYFPQREEKHKGVESHEGE